MSSKRFCSAGVASGIVFLNMSAAMSLTCCSCACSMACDCSRTCITSQNVMSSCTVDGGPPVALSCAHIGHDASSATQTIKSCFTEFLPCLFLTDYCDPGD